MNEEIEKKIQDYLDGTLSDAERELVNKKIEENSDWKRIYHEFLLIEKVLKMKGQTSRD